MRPHVPQPLSRADAERIVAGNMAEGFWRSSTLAVVFEQTLIGTVNLEVGRAVGGCDTT